MVKLNFLGFGSSKPAQAVVKKNIVDGVSADTDATENNSGDANFLPLLLGMLLGQAKTEESAKQMAGEKTSDAQNAATQETIVPSMLFRNLYFKKSLTAKEAPESKGKTDSAKEQRENTVDGEVEEGINTAGEMVMDGENSNVILKFGGVKNSTEGIAGSESQEKSVSAISSSKFSAEVELPNQEFQNFEISKEAKDQITIQSEKRATELSSDATMVDGNRSMSSDNEIQSADTSKNLHDRTTLEKNRQNAAASAQSKNDPSGSRHNSVPKSSSGKNDSINEISKFQNVKIDQMRSNASTATVESGSTVQESQHIEQGNESAQNFSSSNESNKGIDRHDVHQMLKGNEGKVSAEFRIGDSMVNLQTEKSSEVSRTTAGRDIQTAMQDHETIQSVMDQLSKHVALAVDEKSSQMKLLLKPESLGEVTLHVKVEEGRVSTHMEVQQPQVKAVIESNIPVLREALSSKGLTVENINVFTTQYSLNEKSTQHHQQRSNTKSYLKLHQTDETEEQSKMLGYNTVEYVM